MQVEANDGKTSTHVERNESISKHESNTMYTCLFVCEPLFGFAQKKVLEQRPLTLFYEIHY